MISTKKHIGNVYINKKGHCEWGHLALGKRADGLGKFLHEKESFTENTGILSPTLTLGD